MDKLVEPITISVVIASFNRFKFLLNTIRSIQNQTVKPLEIIVVNDKSTQKEYYTHRFTGINIIHLEKNSKEVLGYASPGYVRNFGIRAAQGNYIAFCDDDDIWLPKKLEKQIEYIQKSGCKMACSEALIGGGPFESGKSYKKYNGEHYRSVLTNIFKKGGKDISSGLPPIFDLNLIKIHNVIICSSVLVDKNIITRAGLMPDINRGEDYKCWLAILELTNCVYVNLPLVYYDKNHGNGSLY